MSDAGAHPHADHVLRVAGQELAVSTDTHVSRTVDISWRRCLDDFKLDPARDYQPTILDQSRLKDLHAEYEDLVQIARAEMDALYEQIAGSGYALLLADPDGVILCAKVDPVLKRMFVQAGLIAGAQWSEKSEGTNGIGTCAAEARPITIHESDHFRSRHVGLSCSAAPIHDSNGRLMAVLDASSVNAGGTRDSKMHTVALVNSSARLIEKCLFLRHHRADAMLRFHHRPEFVDLLHDGAIAVATDGTIVATDMTGLKLLGAQDRKDLIGCSIADVFDTTYEELAAAADAGRRAMWELRDNRFGRRYYASLVGADQHRSRRSIASPATSGDIVHVAHADSAVPLTLEDLAGDDPRMLRHSAVERLATEIRRGAGGPDRSFWLRVLDNAAALARMDWAEPEDPQDPARDRGDRLRDEQMAANLVWLARERHPSAKIIVWAATRHILGDPAAIRLAGAGARPAYGDRATAMGREARRTLGDAVFALGFLTSGGAAGRFWEAPFQFMAPGDGSLEDLLRRAGPPLAILNLRRPGPGGEWLREPLLARPLGYVAMRADWTRSLDALFYIREMTPSTRAPDGGSPR